MTIREARAFGEKENTAGGINGDFCSALTVGKLVDIHQARLMVGEWKWFKVIS